MHLPINKGEKEMKLLITIWTLYLALFIGWIANIVAIINTCCAVIDGMMVARVIGIFVAPLGGVLGWF